MKDYADALEFTKRKILKDYPYETVVGREGWPGGVIRGFADIAAILANFGTQNRQYLLNELLDLEHRVQAKPLVD